MIDNVDPDDLICVVWNSKRPLTVAWIALRLAIPDGDAAGDRVDELKTQYEDCRSSLRVQNELRRVRDVDNSLSSVCYIKRDLEREEDGRDLDDRRQSLSQSASDHVALITHVIIIAFFRLAARAVFT